MTKLTRRSLLGGTSAVLAGSTIAAEAAPAARGPLRADVCIVGAGFAGLAAAYRLKQSGARVVVLEARSRVGGRSWTVRHKDGAFIDYGGQWVGPTQDEFYKLIKEMGCETYPSPDAGRTLQRGIMTDELYRTEQNGAYPDFDAGEKALDSVDALANTIDVDAPWKHPDAQRLDAVTFAEWLRQTHSEERVRRYLAPEVGAVPCASPEEISMLHLGWLIKACHGLKILFADQGGAQQDRVIGGTQPVAQRLAAKLGKAIRTGNPVRRIAWNDRGATVYADKLSVSARRVIVAVPPALAGAIEYDPIPGVSRTQLMQRWPQGLVIKVQMMYAAPFWRDDGLSGTSFDHLSPLGETADSSTPAAISRAGILTGFVYADHARRLALLSETERKSSHPARSRQPLRPEGAGADRLPRVQLVDAAVDARLLHGIPDARRNDVVRLRGARSGRAAALGRHRDVDRLAVLHRRRDQVRLPRRRRDHQARLGRDEIFSSELSAHSARLPPPKFFAIASRTSLADAMEKRGRVGEGGV